MSRSGAGRDLVLFSSADWKTPYWTNKQHIAQRLAERGWSVLYVETVGLRAPGLGRFDGRRMLRRLAAAASPPRTMADGLWVASPLTLPFGHRLDWVRKLNARLLGAMLKHWLGKLDFHHPAIWTYHPFMMEAIVGLDRRALIYHCVDELAAVPGIDGLVFAKAERELLQTADLVFATSSALNEKCKAASPNTHYLPNVADIGLFASARTAGSVAPDLAEIPRPRLGYAGVLSDFKLDFPLLLKLAERRPAYHLVFIGDERVGQRDADAERLRSLANVHFLGWRDYRRLPDYFRGLDIGLLPLRINAYTRAVFPMKFFEYLAAGLPVVATALPALQEHRDLHRWSGDDAGFIAAIDEVLADRPRYVLAPDHGMLREHDWATQLDRMLALIERVEV